MNPPGHVLETERLLVRPFRREDWRAVHAYMSRPEVVRFLPEVVFSEADARAWVGEAVAALAANPEAQPERLAVLLRTDGQLVGHALFPTWYGPRCREIGYVLHPDHHGRGLATEAAAELLRHGFETLALHRIIATCDDRNRASWRVMEKLGMRQEALFRQCLFLHDEWIDERHFAILAEEWAALRIARGDTAG